MKRLLLSAICLLFTLLCAAKEITGYVIKVADGDTITLLDAQKEKQKVRFYGIDAPESNQAYGKDSGAVLTELIFHKNVRVEVVNTDVYGRNVGKVYLDDLYINLEMVKRGCAWYYPQYAPRETDLKDAEAEAREQRLGLWKGRDPMPPWEFRREKKNNGNKSQKQKKRNIITIGM